MGWLVEYVLHKGSLLQKLINNVSQSASVGLWICLEEYLWCNNLWVVQGLGVFYFSLLKVKTWDFLVESSDTSGMNIQVVFSQERA